MEYVKYYIRLNENNRIIKAFSSAFEESLKTDIEIGQGFGSQFRANSEVLNDELQIHAGVENGLPLYNEKHQYQLEFVDGVIYKISDEVLESEYVEPIRAPTKMEIIQKELLQTQLALCDVYENMSPDDGVTMYAMLSNESIASVYASLISKDKKTIDDVPEGLKVEVNIILATNTI